MNLKIPIIFAGTADIGSPLLEAIHRDERFHLKGVITQEDRPAGRKMTLSPSPIKIKAQKLGLSVMQPNDINTPDSLKMIQDLQPAIILVIAYGQLFKSELLSLPKFGCINVHGSLLPHYRGASPIQQSLLNQDKETGISLIQMTEAMDSGPIFAEFKLAINKEDNVKSLYQKLSELSALKTPDILYQIAKDKINPTAQNEDHASYCEKIQKKDGLIHWDESADQIMAKIKAFAGWPGTFTFWQNKRLKIISADEVAIEHQKKPGLIELKNQSIVVYCKKNALKFIEIQLEGKKKQSVESFIKGQPDFINSYLESS